MKTDIGNNLINLEEAIIEREKIINEMKITKDENKKKEKELLIVRDKLEKVGSIADSA